MDKIIEAMENEYQKIYENRVRIEELKKNKVELKPQLWEEAGGTVDQKKDYIRARTSDYDMDIRLLEAKIEHSYNLIKVLDYKMVYCDE
jgi:hypothetical protein